MSDRHQGNELLTSVETLLSRAKKSRIFTEQNILI